ncbi:AI-2E family transporter [Rubrolithibacter danxiaensis]|uniref:AI-2E family transporter n=1 Tax=Rubrolithibacter danxiaensis TaxID=3390805 RepID=UPI003BF8A996
MPEEKANVDIRNYLKRVWIAVSVAALVILIILLLKASINVVLMVLAGSLIALFFHGFADLIQRKIKLSHRWSMVIAIGSTFLLLILLFWLIGSKVESQLTQLSDKFPTMLDQAKSRLNETPVGQKILDQTSGQNSKKLISSVRRFFSSTFGVLGDLYVILFLGIFFTAGPSTYKKGIIALIPPKGKKEGENVLNILGHNLKNWLKGKFFSMAVVAVLTAIGLSIIGVPMIFALAIIAGVLNFIPNFGPIIAMIPAVLIGLSQGVNTALIIACLYIFIQALESNLITPTVQKKLVSIPPALIIIGQLIVGSLTGYLGIILATPVVLIIMTLVQQLYIKKQDE